MATRFGKLTIPRDRPPKTALQRQIEAAERKQWEDMLEAQLRMAELFPERQYKALAPAAGYVWDFAFPKVRLLIEVDGQIWHKGGHTTGIGITRDAEKQSMAAAAGWRTIRVTPQQVESGQALIWIEAAARWGPE